jgi:hypothetical protein
MTISHTEIKEKLVRHHNPGESPRGQSMSVVHAHSDSIGEDTILFLLEGIPPKGYGIFMQGRKLLLLYTTRGRPFEEIRVDEVTAVRP